MSGFLDSMREAINATINKTSAIFGDVPTLKATMMGPRAVGKTSIMASIFSETVDMVAGTGLYFRPSEESFKQLSKKRLELKNIFEDRREWTNPHVGVIAASNNESRFVFEIGLTGKEKSANIEITDFPGEYLQDREQLVSDYIKESQIVMIAIDTPYLMEEGGLYNEDKNKVQLVTDFIVNHPDEIKNKLIMLVPLKSERYFHDKRINEVGEKVKSVYTRLIEFCKDNNIACAVTPIQTLGGVELDNFVDNSTAIGISKLPRYRFWTRPDSDKPRYTPMFCVQPMYYLMAYVSNYYEWLQNQPSGIWDTIKNSIYGLLKQDKKFFSEIKEMSHNVLVDKNGYSLINKNSILKIN